MTRKILVVTKDVGGFHTARPVAEALRSMGHEVLLMAEGLSVGRWEDIGWSVHYEGSRHAQPMYEETLDKVQASVSRFLHSTAPDVVVVTCGSPIGLEKIAAHQAQHMIKPCPVVVLEDVWGVSSRIDVPVAMIVTPDETGEQMVRSHERFRDARIVRARNPAVEGFRVGSDQLRKLADAVLLPYKASRTVLVCGEGEGTLDILHILLSSLAATYRVHPSTTPCVIFPRFHPKYAGIELNRMTWERQLQMFQIACPSAKVVQVDPSISTDALATVCNVTVSGSSTTLLHAAKHLHMAVSVNTPMTRKLLQAQVPYERFPGIDAGIALELTEVHTDLFFWLYEQQAALMARQNAYFDAPTSSATEIAGRILSLVR